MGSQPGSGIVSVQVVKIQSQKTNVGKYCYKKAQIPILRTLTSKN